MFTSTLPIASEAWMTSGGIDNLWPLKTSRSLHILIDSVFGFILFSARVLQHHPQLQTLGSLNEYIDVLWHDQLLPKGAST